MKIKAAVAAFFQAYSFMLWANTSNGFSSEVRKIVDRRCVVCHGCYSSPCNLKLDSAWGLERGGSKDDIYASRPVVELPPNRIFQDTYTTDIWRSSKYKFHSVTEPREGKSSIVSQLLEASYYAKREGSSSFKFLPEKSRTCAKNQEELDKHLLQNGPQSGMPYGTYPLSKDEFELLNNAFSGKYKAQNLSLLQIDEMLSDGAREIGGNLENLLNRPELKAQLVARYLYEHLFSAHIHFSATGSREFYRLVRSSSRHGVVEELATRRPYDRPEGKFYYRLKKVVETIVLKNHSPFEISHEILKKWEADFYQTNYTVSKMPKYGNKAANPFRTFNQIPPQLRYKFFLENAYYFVRTFIHGPVCNGQVATNVIRDQFWILMLDPKYDLLSTHPQFEKKYFHLLNLPASTPHATSKGIYSWPNYIYQIKAAKKYNKLWHGQLSPSMIWTGDKKDKNAALTVYRHFKSAGVYNGLIGSQPKTVWVMDYSIFERIYYDLVAGFDVYGNSFHKLTTRIYMDILRTEAEDMFLSMFDKSSRIHLRSYWNRGYGAFKRFFTPYVYAQKEGYLSQENYSHKVLVEMLKRQGDEVVGVDQLNRDAEIKALLPKLWWPLSQITSKTGSYPRYFPEVTILKVKLNDGSSKAFSILANKDRPFANHLFLEPKNPEGDVLNIIEGLDVTHVNLFMQVKQDDLFNFSRSVQSLASNKDWQELVQKYAIGRMNKEFWSFSDWIFDEMPKLHPLRGGVIDYTRLE